jgi:hypothetical protein
MGINYDDESGLLSTRFKNFSFNSNRKLDLTTAA